MTLANIAKAVNGSLHNAEQHVGEEAAGVVLDSRKVEAGYVFIPTIGCWEKAEDINFDELPEQFVLKCNHDSGGLVICRDKERLDRRKAKKKLSVCLRNNGYYYAREWPYKNVKPCIIAEPYMEDSESGELSDYKFFVFKGKVRAMFIATDRFGEGETKFDFYDEEFTHLDFVPGHPNATKAINKLACFDEMKEMAEKLAKNLRAARVDFYQVDGKVYFGEITFFHFSGLEPFKPDEWDYKLSETPAYYITAWYNLLSGK